MTQGTIKESSENGMQHFSVSVEQSNECFHDCARALLHDSIWEGGQPYHLRDPDRRPQRQI